MHFYRCSRKYVERVSLSSVVICFVIAVRTIAGQVAGGESVVGHYSDRRGVPLFRSTQYGCRDADVLISRSNGTGEYAGAGHL
jgi:hypothetical protein